MNIRRPVVSFLMRRILNILCRIDNSELSEALTNNGPLILAVNHINFLEVPILVAHSYPLYMTGLVKSETWNNPIMAFLANTYHAIPIDRKGAFQEAFKKVVEAVKKGFYVIIAPEGTRSKDGILGKGKAGIVQLALEYDVPVLPVAHYGGERIWKNMRRLRRTSFCLRAGKPFRIRYEGKPDRQARDEMLGEVMGQIARLLPMEMRGIYSRHAESDCKYLEFLT